MGEDDLTFVQLIGSIRQIHEQLVSQAGHAINISLTLRNWLIGMHISEFQLRGKERAKYGENLFSELARELKTQKISACGRRQLYNYVAFYRTYPQIVRTVSAQFKKLLPASVKPGAKVRTLSPQLHLSPEKLLSNLSYSHFELLIEAEEPLKRAFYEIECIRGNWSVRELKRQIASLYYERSGLSKNKKKLAELVKNGVEAQPPALNIRDPYIFEFLGIKPREVMAESDLEDSLLDKLQEFLLELGHGFCFEARQKRILIGGEYFFVDLVFYHRILKCHVLIELKVDEFTHEYLGQLNTYVAWYKDNEMSEGDYPPIGILLCTQKNHALVKFALSGISNRLFVSRYQFELPKKEEIEQFLESQLNQK